MKPKNKQEAYEALNNQVDCERCKTRGYYSCCQECNNINKGSCGKFMQCVCHSPQQVNYQDEEITKAILQRTQSIITNRILTNLPAKFWEDEDHAVGGYISKKDLKKLLEDMSENIWK